MDYIVAYFEDFQRSAWKQVKSFYLVFYAAICGIEIFQSMMTPFDYSRGAIFLSVLFIALVLYFKATSYTYILLNGFLYLSFQTILYHFKGFQMIDFGFMAFVVLMTGILLFVENRHLSFKMGLVSQIDAADMANENLVSMYEELEANEEELRAQYEEILENKNYLELIQKRNMLLFSASNEVIWELDLKTGRRHFSDETYVEELKLDMIQSESFRKWAYDLHPEDQNIFIDAMNRVRQGISQSEVFETRVNDLNGGWKWLKSKVVSLVNPQGDVILMAGSYSDIDVKKKDDERIRHLAYFDPLTGLLNRISLLKTIQDRLEESIPPICEGVLFYMDMDGFKMVNNTYGHDIGDQLILQIAERISAMRPYDSIARLGGADFVLLTSEQAICSSPIELGNQLQQLLNRPFIVEEKSIFLTVCIGITVFTAEVALAGTVLRQADIALRSAKELGKEKCILYTHAMSDAVSDKVLMLNELRYAVERKELYLCFQPQIDTASGELYGFEALCRWQSHTYGNIPPLKFIPLAEETGLIIPLGVWIFEEACRFLTEAMKINNHLLISVNVASQQLLHPSFNDDLEKIMEAEAIHPERVCIEITESTLIESMDLAISTLENLKSSGFKIALDDFGTGFSSLSYLNQLPIDQLKIDRSFTKRVTFDSKEYSLIKSIMQISKDLNLNLVVEGIEENVQVEIVKSLGNPIIQGYYYGKPMRAEEALAWAKDWDNDRSHVQIDELKTLHAIKGAF